MWVKIYCKCGKLLAEAKAGSVIRKVCKCGTVNEVTVKQPFANKKPEVLK